jgi:hypothetical protein
LSTTASTPVLIAGSGHHRDAPTARADDRYPAAGQQLDRVQFQDLGWTFERRSGRPASGIDPQLDRNSGTFGFG